MAIAQAHMAAVYNREGFDLINNYTYGADCFA
jgi:transketolase